MEPSPQSPSSGSYNTEIAYPNAYHRDLNPTLHTLALHVRGMFAPAAGEAFSYLELGCTWGLSTLIHAAGHQGSRFVGVDVNPVHTAAGREVAAAAGLNNIEFIDADFTDLAQRDLAPVDTIALHGIWSWIDARARDGVVQVANRHLKDGGLMYLSYNALPGNGPAADLRRLMMIGFDRTQGPVLARIESGIGLAAHVKETGAAFFKANPVIAQRLDQVVKPAPREYLAHEYFNGNWQAFYHADVAAMLQPAGLAFACTTHLPDFIDEAQLSAEARRLINTAPDSAARETLRDFYVNCLFRRDLFCRGGLAATAKNALMATRFVGTYSPDTFDRISGHSMLGEIKPKPEPGRAIVAALAEGPKSANELAQHPGCSTVAPEVLLEALMVLAAVGAAEPIQPPEGESVRKAATQRLNHVLMERTVEACRTSIGIRWGALASPVTGGGVAVDPIYQSFLLARAQGRDPVEVALTLATNLGGDELRAAYTRFEADAVPAFASLGIG